MLVNQDDPLKAQLVDDRISSLLTQANLLLSGKIATSPPTTRGSSRTAATFEIPFLGQTVRVLGLQKAARSSTRSRPACRRISAARSPGSAPSPGSPARTSALADSLLSSIRQPIAVDKRVVAGSIPPLDTFAVAVAAAVTLLFVTVLLVPGSLALEREENTFTRLTRGLVSREGLLMEKTALGTGARS